MRNKIIQNAVAEIGYKEGANNENKYSQELYNIKAQEWCADFVRWCLIKAGAGDLYPKSSYVPTIAEWYDQKGLYKNSKANGGNYTPQTADIILFDYNHNSTSDHIGLVEKVANGKVYTIEGNKDNMVKRCEYDLDCTDIRAYCVPSYEETEEKPKEIVKYVKTSTGIGVNVRSGAGTNYNRVGGLADGTKVVILEEKNGFSRIDVGKWVCSEYLVDKEVKIYKTVTAKSGLNIRESATTVAKRIGGVSCNKKVEILQENVATANGYKWDKIKYNNLTGYVANSYLK